jgi:hypothetical protein
MGQVAALPIYLPPLALQHRFATFVQQADKSKFIFQNALLLCCKLLSTGAKNIIANPSFNRY